MDDPACPPNTKLLAWLQDQLDAEQDQLLSSHLDSCLLCQKCLDRLDNDEQLKAAANETDSWLEDFLGQMTEDAFETEPECARACQLAVSTRIRAADGSVMRSAEAIDLEASTQLGNYEILGVLGRGDMGVVDKARQLKANRVVALKMMLSSRHASMQERFAFRSRPRP